MLNKIIFKNTAKLIGLLGVSVASLAVAPSAHALTLTLTPYTTQATFNAATSGLSTPINFSGVNVINGQYQFEGQSTTQNGVTFGAVPTSNGSNTGLYVVSTTYNNNSVTGNGFNSSAGGNPVQSLLDYETSSPTGITANVSGLVGGGTYAVATDILGIRGATSPQYTITATGINGAIATYTLSTSTTIPNSTFIGFTASSPLASIEFQPTDSATQVQISNFEYGALAASTPGVPFETNSALGIAVIGCFWSGNLLLKKMNKKEFTS